MIIKIIIDLIEFFHLRCAAEYAAWTNESNPHESTAFWNILDILIRLKLK